MGVTTHGGTMPGAVTPVCNECGMHLCWDLSDEEYAEEREFWDAWLCEVCNGGEPVSLKKWRAEQLLK